MPRISAQTMWAVHVCVRDAIGRHSAPGEALFLGRHPRLDRVAIRLWERESENPTGG